jgi:nicotinate-nucleotide adenylyltransferase
VTLPPPAQHGLPDIERIIPMHAPGMRIGLFGGTFDPPHRAHLDACLLAMKRLRLDRVWWLVTPGNPLKNTSRLAPLPDRMDAARKLADHPRIDVTGLEAVINTRYTFDTIEWLIGRCPRVDFVWIMGADNLRHFHRWQKWRAIAELIPIVVVDRPGPSLYASNGTAAQALWRYRVPETSAVSLPGRKPPAWTFLHGMKSGLSSTSLRAMRANAAALELAASKQDAVETTPKAAPKTRKSSSKKKSRAPAKASVKTAKKKPAAKTSQAKKTTAKPASAKTTSAKKKTAASKRGSRTAARRKAGRKRTK